MSSQLFDHLLNVTGSKQGVVNNQSVIEQFNSAVFNQSIESI